MEIRVFESKSELSQAAADHAAKILRRLLGEKVIVRLVAATGASQFEFSERLTSLQDIDWARVEMFHLDEYVGLPVTHPASFRKYLMERLIGKTKIGKYYLLEGEHRHSNTTIYLDKSSAALLSEKTISGA